MKTFEDLRTNYEEETGQKIIGWVDDYSEWLEKKLLEILVK